MSDLPALGKATRPFFDQVIYPFLGAPRPEVLVGPRHGVDVAIVALGGRQVLACTTDPLSVIPALGLEDSAWLTVQILASDLATSGLAPAYAVLDFNLPPTMSAADFETYWRAMHAAWSELGVAVVAGHTGRYQGCDYTIFGGGTLLAVGPADGYVTSSMAQTGDQLLVTKGAAIAATGILARVFPERVRDAYGEPLCARAAEFFWKITTVGDALTAAAVGLRERGVTAMHDATEGGVLGGLHELAVASGLGLRVEQARIPVAEDTVMAVVRHEVALDEWSASAYGKGGTRRAPRPRHVSHRLFPIPTCVAGNGKVRSLG